jgi:hypothetical protein
MKDNSIGTFFCEVLGLVISLIFGVGPMIAIIFD